MPSHWLQVTLVFTVCLLDCTLEACLEVFTELSPLLTRIAMEGELVNGITDNVSESYRGLDTQCVHLVLIQEETWKGKTWWT